jgi:hypothetical protein
MDRGHPAKEHRTAVDPPHHQSEAQRVAPFRALYYVVGPSPIQSEGT